MIKDLIKNGFSPTTFEGFISLVRDANAAFTATEDDYSILLTSHVDGLRIATYIDKPTQSGTVTNYRSRLEPYANQPPFVEEVRFYTHDFSDKRTWTSETTGEMTSWVEGAETYDDIQCRWLDSEDAMVAYLDQTSFPAVWKDSNDDIIVQYYATSSVPEAHKSTSNTGVVITNTEFSEAPVSGTYELTLTSGTSNGTYKIIWGNDSEDNLVWIPNSLFVLNGEEQGKIYVRMSTTPPASLPQTDQVQVLSLPHPINGDWKRVDNNEIVTTSRWRMLPYYGYRIQINEAWLSCDSCVLFQKPVHYEFYTDLPQYNLTNYKAKDWKYKDINTFRAGSNIIPFVEPITLDGHFGPIITFGYDYSKTIPQVVDSMLNQYIDIYVEDDQPLLNTKGSRSTFIAKKIRSY